LREGTGFAAEQGDIGDEPEGDEVEQFFRRPKTVDGGQRTVFDPPSTVKQLFGKFVCNPNTCQIPQGMIVGK
jgi:hypothetical protein